MNRIEGLECPACGEKSLIYQEHISDLNKARAWADVVCEIEGGCGDFLAEYTGDTPEDLLTILGIESSD